VRFWIGSTTLRRHRLHHCCWRALETKGADENSRLPERSKSSCGCNKDQMSPLLKPAGYMNHMIWTMYIGFYPTNTVHKTLINPHYYHSNSQLITEWPFFFEFDKSVHILWIKIRFKPGSEFVLPNCDIILFKSLNHLLVSFSIFLSSTLNHLMLLHFGPTVLPFVFIKH